LLYESEDYPFPRKLPLASKAQPVSS